MHMKKTRTWKKLTALMIAALMILSVLPAALALPDQYLPHEPHIRPAGTD